ncbi:MAG: flavodoxin domain-containing protein [Candidatus Carbobacillus altaicus]|nr:flavodoxin domain-containing protein [Candidatus Carbobacillus altaicus]
MEAAEKIFILYTSLSGNTEETAHIIADEVEGKVVDIVRDLPGLNRALASVRAGEVGLLFLGTYTWGDGVLPLQFRKLLRSVLIEEKEAYLPYMPLTAVFGTGDTIFPRFCRAVDETVYHLQKHGVTVFQETLKIEQSPYGLGQEARVRAFARNALQGASIDEGKRAILSVKRAKHLPISS